MTIKLQAPDPWPVEIIGVITEEMTREEFERRWPEAYAKLRRSEEAALAWGHSMRAEWERAMTEQSIPFRFNPGEESK